MLAHIRLLLIGLGFDHHLQVEIYPTDHCRASTFGLSESIIFCVLRPVACNERSAFASLEGGAMSVTLPLEVEPYIIKGSPADSLRAVTAAAERGEFGFEIVAKLAAVIARGVEPRFAKTKPIPLYVLEYLRQHEDKMLPTQTIWVGVRDGLWSEDVAIAFCENQAVLSEAKRKPAPRGVYLTRNRRKNRILPKVDGRFVPKMSLEALLEGHVRDGAKTCLALLLSLAGKANVLITWTSAIATQLGRCTRTIRNYFIELEESGLIQRKPGKEPNTVEITFSPACKPEPYKEPLDIKAFKLARRTSNTVLRNLADTLTLMSWKEHEEELCPDGGRKEISAFNSESYLNRKTDTTSVTGSGVTTHSTISITRPKTFFRKLSQTVIKPKSHMKHEVPMVVPTNHISSHSEDNFGPLREAIPIRLLNDTASNQEPARQSY